MDHRLDLFPGNELIQQYRQVFSSAAGQEVLAHILFDLGTFQVTGDDPESVALKNYGNRIVNILAGGEVEKNSIEEFTRRIMRQPLNKGESNNE